MTSTKAGALRVILIDARANRNTRTSYGRVLKALNVLEIESDERLGILGMLEYTGPDGYVRDRYLKKT